MILILRWCNYRLHRENERVLMGMELGERERESMDLRERLAWSDVSDRKNVFFRYTH